MSLAAVSEEDLIEELARRRRKRDDDRPIKHCDECRNFKAWAAPDGPLDDYNPCQQGHTMSFKVPDSPSGDDWGFYRRVCGDRTPLTGSGGA